MGNGNYYNKFFFFLSNPIYLFTTGLYLGPELLGTYATIEIFSRFSNLFVFSTNNYSMSAGSRINNEKGFSPLFAFIRQLYGKVFVILILGCIFILLFGWKILNFVYEDKINGYYLLLPLLVLRILTDYLCQPLGAILNLLKMPKGISLSYMISSIFTLFIMVPLIKFFSIYGIAIGQIITNIIVFLLLIIVIRKKWRVINKNG